MAAALIVFRDGSTATEVRIEDYSFTFPISSAELTPGHVEHFGLTDGLARFARAMLAQMCEHYVGVEIHSIGVTFLKAKRDQRP